MAVAVDKEFNDITTCPIGLVSYQKLRGGLGWASNLINTYKHCVV